MGGGRQFSYPKWVWSSAGGWWPNPTNWRRNTVAYGVAVIGIALYAYQISEANTKVYSPPKVTASTHDHEEH